MESTCVLPVPALALTQADVAGSAAAAWLARVSSRAMSSGDFFLAKRPIPHSSSVVSADHSATRARWA